MANTESAENYLETILVLSKRLPVVRSVDVATELGFKKSSVSIAMKNLRQHRKMLVTRRKSRAKRWFCPFLWIQNTSIRKEV